MANSDQLKRRTFLTAGSAAGLMLPALADTRDRAEWPQLRPSTIHVLFIGRSGATTNAAGKTVQYLTWGQDEITKMNEHLAGLAKKLCDVRFVGGETIPPADAGQVASRAAGADGLLLVWLSGHGGDYATLEKLNFGLDKPAVSFFQPFSGHGWMWHQQWKERKVLLLSTTDRGELDEAVSLLRVPALMKQTRILAIDGPRGTAAACSPGLVKSNSARTWSRSEPAGAGDRTIERKAAEEEVRITGSNRRSGYWSRRARRSSIRALLSGGEAPDGGGEGAGSAAACMGTPGVPYVQQAE